MEQSEIKANLNTFVRLVDVERHIDCDYLMTGCILRKNEQGFAYSAELRDLKAKSSLVADLAKVMAKRWGEEMKKPNE